MLTAYDLIWMAAERSPDALALVDDQSGRRFTYRQLIAETDRIAAGLWQRGLRPGDRVATVLPNRLEYPLVLIALTRIGAVPALMNFRLEPNQLAALIRDGECRGAIVGDNPGLIDALRAAMGPDHCLLVTDGGGGPLSFAGCTGDPALLPGRHRPAPEDTAFIFYTSGTTGEPKGVLIPHRASEPRLAWIVPSTGLMSGAELRALGASPLFHAIGFYAVFLFTLAYNGTYYTLPAFDPAATVDLIERHRITFVFAIPTMFQALLSAPNYLPERLRSIEHVIYGGQPIAPGLLERMQDEWPAMVRHAYGTTELMAALYHPDPVSQPRTLRPCYGARIRVIQIGGSCDDVVAPGVAGELITDGTTDCMFTGYLNKPEATQQKLHDGWYFTGDIAIPHASGDLDLVGRIDDMIRSGGESVYPEEVENIIASHGGVRENCVLGLPDALWGEMVVACVVRRDAALSSDDLDRHCRDSVLANFKRPRAYVFADALPRNASNKILRRVLREQLLAAKDPGRGARTTDIQNQMGVRP